MLVVVLIPVELNPIGLIMIFPVIASLFTYTEVEVPIPTYRLGWIFKLITSPFDNPRDLEVDTETIELIFSTLAVIWLKLLSIEYS